MIAIQAIEKWPRKPATHYTSYRFDSSYSKTVDLLEKELGYLNAHSVALQLWIKAMESHNHLSPLPTSNPPRKGATVIQRLSLVRTVRPHNSCLPTHDVPALPAFAVAPMKEARILQHIKRNEEFAEESQRKVHAQPVICNGKAYPSASEAGWAIGVSSQTIRRAAYMGKPVIAFGPSREIIHIYARYVDEMPTVKMLGKGAV